MPLKQGRSKAVRRDNTRELLETHAETGKIGNTRPRSKAHAARIATAVARRKAGLPVKSGSKGGKQQ